MAMTLHTRLHTLPFWYLPGMPIPVVPARDESANMAIIPKHTVLCTGLIVHPPCLTVRARDGQAEMAANKIHRVRFRGAAGRRL